VAPIGATGATGHTGATGPTGRNGCHWPNRTDWPDRLGRPRELLGDHSCDYVGHAQHELGLKDHHHFLHHNGASGGSSAARTSSPYSSTSSAWRQPRCRATSSTSSTNVWGIEENQNGKSGASVDLTADSNTHGAAGLEHDQNAKATVKNILKPNGWGDY
jgi:hypothetical protein